MAKHHWDQQKYNVLDQIHWYMNHIQNADNKIDLNVVCDYDLELTDVKGVYLQKKYSEKRPEYGIGQCADSTDSYHATFLILIAQVLENDPKLLFEYMNSKNNHFKSQMHLILNSLFDLEHDSLTVAKKSYPIKYAMDNVEVLFALRNFQQHIALLNNENLNQILSSDDLLKLIAMLSRLES